MLNGKRKLTVRAWILASTIVWLTLTGCGGGDKSAAPQQASSESNSSSTTTVNPTTSSDPIPFRFGKNNFIDVIAGEQSSIWPVEIEGNVTGLVLRIVDGPTIATVVDQKIVVNAESHLQKPAEYQVTLEIFDSSGKVRGRQIGSIQVSSIQASSSARTVANSSTSTFSEAGISIETTSDAFPSGSASIKVDRVIDSKGNIDLRIQSDQPIERPLTLNYTATASGQARALSVRQKSTSGIETEISTCDVQGFEGTYAPSVADVCARVWTAPTVEVTCDVKVSDPATRQQTTKELWRSTVSRNTIPATKAICTEGSTTVIGNRVWSRLVGPKDWDNESFDWSNKVPVVLIHGYNPDILGFSGAHGTWGNIRDYLEASTLPGGKRFSVFEFQWLTNTSFRSAAKDFAEAIDLIYKTTNARRTTPEKAIIIAHSFGGIVARYYLQFGGTSGNDSATSVSRLITIGTPHSGIAGTLFSRNELPIGRDTSFISGCRQISCYEAGEGFVLPFDNWLGLNKEEPGDLILNMGDLAKNPIPSSVKIDVLIGLRLIVARTDGTTATYKQDSGDGLISFAGQRFLPQNRQLTPAPLLQRGSSSVEERIIGFTPNSIPDFSRT